MEPSVIDWLLEEADPSVQYRTLTELLDLPASDPQVQRAKSLISTSKPVQKIFAHMHPDGYWLYRGLGEGVDYAISSSTHFVLAFLAELGIDRSDPRMAKAVERYLGLRAEQLEYAAWIKVPDYQSGQSCLYAYNLRTFIRLGYRDDPRVQARIDTLLGDTRPDGGYLCRRSNFSAQTKSCIRGTVKALTAFAEIPELWGTGRCQDLVNYFLRRRIYYRTDRPDQIIRGEVTSTIFPFVIAASLLEPLVALSAMGYGIHPALQPAWEMLETKKDAAGRYILDWYPNSYLNPGPKKQANKWATFYACLAIKQKER